MAVQTWGVIIWTVLTGFSSEGPAASAFHQLADHSGRTAECETCHRFPATRTHVTGVRPTFDMAATYPLGPSGELTCVTCHDLTLSSASNGRSLLRGALDDSSFCTSCHALGADDGSRLAHAMRVGTAHGGSTPTRRGNRPAAASLDCMGCHDGVIGQDGHWPGQREIAGSGLDRGHPVRVNYANAQTSSGELTPAPLFNVALRLENGEVGCTSCHDAFSRLGNSLVIDNRGSALCLACHRM